MKIVFVILINFIFSQAFTDISFIGTKSLGSAGAVVSNTNDIESVFYNPAGLYSLKLNKKNSLLMGSTKLYQLDFLEHEFLSIGFSNGMALSYQRLGTSNKNSEVIDLDNYSQYGFKNIRESLSKEKSISISQGISLLDDRNSTLSIGYAINYLSMYQNKSAGPNGDGKNGLKENDMVAYSLDFGLFAILRDKIAFGAYAKNITNESISKGSSSAHLPRRLNLGMTYYPTEELITTFALERVLSSNNESSFRFGIEYSLTSSFLLRTGIQINPNRLGAGFSYKFKIVELSYSLLTHPVLPITEAFNLKVHFE